MVGYTPPFAASFSTDLDQPIWRDPSDGAGVGVGCILHTGAAKPRAAKDQGFSRNLNGWNGDFNQEIRGFHQ